MVFVFRYHISRWVEILVKHCSLYNKKEYINRPPLGKRCIRQLCCPSLQFKEGRADCKGREGKGQEACFCLYGEKIASLESISVAFQKAYFQGFAFGIVTLLSGSVTKLVSGRNKKL